MPSESDLVPYQAVAAIAARSALVLAPHADDEVFGCGGSIAAHVRSGVPVSVIVLTDGAGHGEPARRVEESRAASGILGYGAPEFWSYPDRALRCDEELVQRITQALADGGADLLYAPSPWEVHPDHRQAAAAAAEAARRSGVRLAFYEIGAPLRPNLLLDITALADTKLRAMQCFVSQHEHQDYGRHIRALNEYRSYSLTREVIAAEAYLVLCAAELDAGLADSLGAWPASFGASPSPAATQPQPPLVSVLVRSVDRELLAEALDSVALQTYPNIEVVVIAAQPNHRPLPQRCGRFPLRLIPTDEALPRSRAANKALAQARGEYLLFLDDDDWLMPGHIARLAHVLQRQPHTRAVYTGVALASPDGVMLGQAFDLPFDGVRQLAGNLMPIQAVLFRRELVAQGCRFDEALDRFEDWDFWLQVARQGTLVHLPGVSAAYRIHPSSGVHEDSGPQGAPTQVIYEKWQAAWSAGQGAALMQRAWSCSDLEVELARVRERLEEIPQLHASLAEQARSIHQLTLQAAEQNHVIAQQVHTLGELARMADSQRWLADERQRQIDDFLRSTSWRVTAPLRWLSSKLRPKA